MWVANFPFSVSSWVCPKISCKSGRKIIIRRRRRSHNNNEGITIRKAYCMKCIFRVCHEIYSEFKMATNMVAEAMQCTMSESGSIVSKTRGGQSLEGLPRQSARCFSTHHPAVYLARMHSKNIRRRHRTKTTKTLKKIILENRANF